MTARNAIRRTVIAAAAAAFLLHAPAALANHTNDVILGANCPDGSANHPCNGGTGTSECRLKSDTGKFVCTDTSTQTGAVTAPSESSGGSAAPVLAIPIPTIKFTNIITRRAGDNVTLTIPWLAEYINGVYRYAIGIAAIVAAVMMMVGGFRWLTAGGDAGRVSAAKENIKDALIGLALTLGGFTLLTVVNSDLGFLKGLDIAMVQKISYEAAELQNTTANTSEGLPPGQIAGSHTNPYTACPLNLTATSNPRGVPERDPRAIQFFEQVGTIATASTLTERVIQIADAAAVCGVYFGSCGRSAGTVYTLAGMGSHTNARGSRLSAGVACLTAPGGCYTHERARQVKSISGAQVQKLWTYKCANGCNSPEKPPNQEGCQADRLAAVGALRNDLTEEIGGGYPDAWAQLLQPGDTLWIYNGYAPCSGLHSVMFLGWGTGGKAQIVDGSAGRNFHASSVCLLSSCGAQQLPIAKIFRP